MIQHLFEDMHDLNIHLLVIDAETVTNFHISNVYTINAKQTETNQLFSSNERSRKWREKITHTKKKKKENKWWAVAKCFFNDRWVCKVTRMLCKSFRDLSATFRCNKRSLLMVNNVQPIVVNCTVFSTQKTLPDWVLKHNSNSKHYVYVIN